MVSDDLNEIAERERSAAKRYTIRCCMAAGCMSSSSQAVKAALETAVHEAGLQPEVEVRGVGCMKLCCQGPLVQIDTRVTATTGTTEDASPGLLYQKVSPEDAGSLVATIKGATTKVERGDPTHPFFSSQLSIVLANCGHVDPERIESYIAAEGYRALHDVLRELTQKDLIEQIIKSGLRGRGGAGYPLF